MNWTHKFYEFAEGEKNMNSKLWIELIKLWIRRRRKKLWIEFIKLWIRRRRKNYELKLWIEFITKLWICFITSKSEKKDWYEPRPAEWRSTGSPDPPKGIWAWRESFWKIVMFLGGSKWKSQNDQGISLSLCSPLVFPLFETDFGVMNLCVWDPFRPLGLCKGEHFRPFRRGA